MNLKCPKTNLLRAVSTVQNVVTGRTTLPVLSNILLEADKKGLRLSATDLNITMVAVAECDVTATGAVAVAGKRLADIVRELPDGDIEIEVDKDWSVTISSSTSVFKLRGIPKDDFPTIQKVPDKADIEVPQAVLGEMIRKTVFAASHDESRHVLNGLYVKLGATRITMVATDGRRLTLFGKEAEIGGEDREMIIPAKAVIELSRVLGDEGNVGLSMMDNQIGFTIDGTHMTCRLIEGTFPNYEQVLPKKNDKVVGLDRTELMQAVRRMSLVTDEKSNSVKFEVSPKQLVLTAGAADVGEGREQISLDYNDEAISIAFNPAFLLDFLKNEGADEICMELGDSLSPGLFRPGEQGADEYLYVVMPIKI